MLMVEEIEAWFGLVLSMVEMGCWSELVGNEVVGVDEVVIGFRGVPERLSWLGGGCSP